MKLTYTSIEYKDEFGYFLATKSNYLWGNTIDNKIPVPLLEISLYNNLIII